MNRVCRVLILLTLPHIATSTLKRTGITDKGSWSVNNEADVENGRVVLKSYDFVETASPLMVEHNFECEMTVERGEGGAISMWIVKDMIKDLDESTFEKDFDGICVRLDTDQESVEIKSGSRFQMQKDATCKRVLTNFKEGSRLTFKIVGGMGSVELHADSEEGWVNCASFDVSREEEVLWGYHHIALSYVSTSESSIQISDLVVTSIEHGPSDAAESSKEDDDIGGMSPDELRDLIYKMRTKHRREISELHDHLEMQFEAMDSHMNKMLNRVREHETRVERRILDLEHETKTKVEDFTEEHISERHRWIGPYAIVFVALCGVALFGYRKYNFLLKQHLL